MEILNNLDPAEGGPLVHASQTRKCCNLSSQPEPLLAVFGYHDTVILELTNKVASINPKDRWLVLIL